MLRLLAAAAALAAASPLAALAAPICSTALTRDQAVALQTRLFEALGREDRGAWEAMATPDFLAHERGKSYTRDSFFQLLTDLHKSGRVITWSVTEPRVEADCNLTVISYVNVGSISLNGAPASPLRWLETAAYRRTPDGWRLLLVTSERTADSSPAS